MTTRIVTYAEHPELLDGREWGEAWPEYNGHGDVLALYWRHLYDVFPEFQFFLYDDEEHVALAKGHSAPCAWDGTIEGLPEGIDDVITQAFTLKDTDRPVNALTGLAIEIPPEHQGRGLSAVMVRALAEVAASHGFQNLVAPVRPNWKERYPLTPMERYAAWTRADGLPFDPWLRIHHRAGGEMLKPVPHSMRITGTVAEWEEWTGMVFPESGSYVFPHGLAPMEIDRDRDLGLYWEPNVWVRHRVESHS
jgi:GNAT superfamily N-acetyltransferase